MGILFLLLIAGLLGWAIGKSGKISNSDLDKELSQRNREWYDFVASYKNKLKSKEEKRIVNMMLADLKKQGVIESTNTSDLVAQAESQVSDPELVDQFAYEDPETSYYDQSIADEPKEIAETEIYNPQKTGTQIELDNAALLLYFGAFLFVASVGLFVAFSGLGGVLKAFSVFILALVLYGVGCWLYKTKKRFKQVGIAFAGIGLAIVPLVGLSVYKYVFDLSYAELTWFITSVFAMVVYAHALWFFRTPLLNYIFIFTILSLFESAVSITSAPIYYFGWAFAFVGIMVTAISAYFKVWPEFRDSATNSGQLLIPLSVIVSLVVLSNQGAIQLGVSLTLAAVFYGLQAVLSNEQKRLNYIIVTHSLLLTAIACFSYGFSEDLRTTGIVMLVVNVLQAISYVIYAKKTELWVNAAGIITSSLLLGSLLVYKEPELLFVNIAILSVFSYLLYVKFAIVTYYIIGAISLMTLPFVYTMYWSSPPVSKEHIVVWVLAAFLVQSLLYTVFTLKKPDDNLIDSAKALLVVSLMAVLATGLVSKPVTYLVVTAVVVVIASLLRYVDKDEQWYMVAGSVTIIPIIKSWPEGGYILLAATIFAIATNAVMGINKSVINRYLAIGSMLVIPIVASRQDFAQDWNFTVYSALYIALMLVFVAMRWGTNFNKTIEDIRSSSLELPLGYMASAFGAVVAAALTTDFIILTIALVSITIILAITALFVEKNNQLLAIIIPLNIASIVVSMFIDAQWWTLCIGMWAGLNSWIIGKFDNNKKWQILAGVYVAIPVIRYWFDGSSFAIATSIGLLINIFIAILYRSEVNRWVGAILWLITPLALEQGWVSSGQSDWSFRAYALAYLVVMVGFMISRAIARGVIAPSSKVPMASFAKNASMSYVTGYIVSAIIAVVCSYKLESNALSVSALVFIAITTTIMSIYIEKDKKLLVFTPAILQLAAISLVAPISSISSKEVLIFTITSTTLAVIGFGVAQLMQDKVACDAIAQSSLLCMLVTPLSVLLLPMTWVMPVGLIIFGLTASYQLRTAEQAYREIIGGVIALAISWLLYYNGVRETQAYTHIIAALFAIYAYWRHVRKELEASTAYVVLALAMTTIPLVKEAMFGLSGDAYGWWLLIEQVVFMMIGVLINNKILIRWGLVVSVLVVLYQLRNLGWAALSVLAIVVIGVAIYKIQSIDHKD